MSHLIFKMNTTPEQEMLLLLKLGLSAVKLRCLVFSARKIAHHAMESGCGGEKHNPKTLFL